MQFSQTSCRFIPLPYKCSLQYGSSSTLRYKISHPYKISLFSFLDRVYEDSFNVLNFYVKSKFNLLLLFIGRKFVLLHVIGHSDGEGGRYSPYTFLTPALDEGEMAVSSPSCTLPPRKGPPTYPLWLLHRRLGGPPSRSQHTRLEEKYFFPDLYRYSKYQLIHAIHNYQNINTHLLIY
jgi:hypothetical protein